jgi:hypothetical protein
VHPGMKAESAAIFERTIQENPKVISRSFLVRLWHECGMGEGLPIKTRDPSKGFRALSSHL